MDLYFKITIIIFMSGFLLFIIAIIGLYEALDNAKRKLAQYETHPGYKDGYSYDGGLICLECGESKVTIAPLSIKHKNWCMTGAQSNDIKQNKIKEVQAYESLET